jgi:hypothetical protein
MLTLGTFIGGCLLNGFVWTQTLKPSVANALIVLGIAMAVGGFIAFILVLKKNRSKNK